MLIYFSIFLQWLFLLVLHYCLGLQYHQICKKVEEVRLCYAMQDRHNVLCVVMSVKAEKLKI